MVRGFDPGRTHDDGRRRYADLARLDRAGWSWEWLRRDPAYAGRGVPQSDQECGPVDGAGERAGGRPPLWGLHFAEDPHLPANHARIMFDRVHDPSVLLVDAVSADAAHAQINLARLAATITILGDTAGREHILLSDGNSRIRLDVRRGTMRSLAVRLQVVFEPVARARQGWFALRRLIETIERGALAPRPLVSDFQATRWRSSLIAWDARALGASHRDIGGLLYGVDRVRNDWDTSSDSLRSQVRRLLAHADHMVLGGWRDLLAGSDGRAGDKADD